MKIVMTRFATRMLFVSAFAALGASVGGCVAGGYEDGSQYEGGAVVGYGVDFYEPYGYEYGGWGRGYRVGPPGRGRDIHPDAGRPGDAHRGGGRPAYHPAPSGHAMPSIPTAPRGGGRAGGARGPR
jgi:hypothetical protein